MENLEKVIAEKIVERLELEGVNATELSTTAPLFSGDDTNSDEENLGLDSVDALELIVIIYENYGIKVEAEEMHKLRTIKAIADLVRENNGK